MNLPAPVLDDDVLGGAGPLVIGLTGGIGAGKSTVAALLAERGAMVIDVDAVGRAVLEPDGGAYRGVIEVFGDGVLAADGAIDRAALAGAVFGTATATTGRLAELEAISHPAINERLAASIATASPGTILVLDMAVLVEARLGQGAAGPWYSRVVVVEAPMALRIERLAGRGLLAPEAERRIAAQASDLERRRVADLVVVNDGSTDDLRAAVAVVWPTVEAWACQESPRFVEPGGVGPG